MKPIAWFLLFVSLAFQTPARPPASAGGAAAGPRDVLRAPGRRSRRGNALVLRRPRAEGEGRKGGKLSITREIYEGFQRGELGRWDAVVAQDVTLDSSGLLGPVQGIGRLKAWATEFLKALKPRIDLVDEFEGDGHRAFLTINMNWKHVEPFFGIQPTGREGTSVETFILTIKDGKVVNWYVADASLDLAIYLWERGWPQGHNKRPAPLVVGVERR